jgi:cytochrome b
MTISKQRMTDAPDAAVRLWDAPVRIIHWSFVALLPALWWTGEDGDLDTHKLIGIVMLGLLAFRVIWGFAGSSTARFAGFVRGPARVLDYLRGRHAEPVVGHNPVGGWSVVLLLTLLIAQAAAGLFAQDVDGIESGPLSYLVSYETADAARELHHLLFNILLGLIAVHIAAILFYAVVKRNNLVTPMLTGRRRFAENVRAPVIAPLWRAGAAGAVAAALAYWISNGAPY